MGDGAEIEVCWRGHEAATVVSTAPAQEARLTI
jgi:hypothetical protein